MELLEVSNLGSDSFITLVKGLNVVTTDGIMDGIGGATG